MSKPSNLPPSIMSHVSIGTTNDYPRAKGFYDEMLGTLQISVMERRGRGRTMGRSITGFCARPRRPQD